MPHCQASEEEARQFRKTSTSQLTIYRCQGVYNLYSSTIFASKQLRPAQVAPLLRGVVKGEPSVAIAREIGVTWQTVLSIRRVIQQRATVIQPETAC